MIVLVSGATRTVGKFDVGTLVVPRARNRPEALNLSPRRWAMDNGAFAGFSEAQFVAMLSRFSEVPGCLFVAAPDLVGYAHATLSLYQDWEPRIRDFGYPVALVAQDGLKPHAVPWSKVDALFLGGTTEFKLGEDARNLADEAKRIGKWLHMGRVNTRGRLHYAERIGCDSVDGSGFSKWPSSMLPKAANWLREFREQPRLFRRTSVWT